MTTITHVNERFAEIMACLQVLMVLVTAHLLPDLFKATQETDLAMHLTACAVAVTAKKTLKQKPLQVEAF